ncbi:hypothetical protein HanIR_Chr16g0834621 [Helianthus annuus]|nr:hypothetical protein HanIR_Chr16g0834621 [Helianthus annuus]
MRWSDLKLLSSLVNLNLAENPVDEKDTVTKKVTYVYKWIMLFTHGQNYFHTPKRPAMAKEGRFGVKSTDKV